MLWILCGMTLVVLTVCICVNEERIEQINEILKENPDIRGGNMFEKEVLEIAKDVYMHHFDDDVKYPDVLNAIIAGTQKGAEFGYNKAKKEAKTIIQDLLDNSDEYARQRAIDFLKEE